MATRDVAKKAGAAALEQTVMAMLPGLQSSLDALRTDIQRLDARVVQLEQKIDVRIIQVEQKIDDRFDQTRDVINELGQRISRVEGKFDGFTEAIRQHSVNVQTLIERVVRVETIQETQGRKAG